MTILRLLSSFATALILANAPIGSTTSRNNGLLAAASTDGKLRVEVIVAPQGRILRVKAKKSELLFDTCCDCENSDSQFHP